MHHISEVHIRNFKSIRDHKFPLSKYTPLVGYNNAGKTNVLKALLWLLKRTSLGSADFYDQSQPVVVEVEVSGVDEDILSGVGESHRGRISAYIVDGKFRIRRQQSIPGQSTTDIRLEIWDPRPHSKDADRWVFNPAGIDQAITALFPEPIHIGAMENATEDVSKFGTNTTIGKLLKEIMDPVTRRHQTEVLRALEGLGGQLSANSANKDPSLMALDQQIGAEIDTLFPGVTVKTHVPLPEFSDLMRAATIKIFEGRFDPEEGRDVSSFGHGAQRSIQMALIKSLAERRSAASDATNRTTLLLIDEPELYLHPQAIAVLKKALRGLAGNGYQVVFTTHSANMIGVNDAADTLLIRRDRAGEDEGTTCLPTLREGVVKAIGDGSHQAETLFELSNSSNILFAQRVVLAEGKTEKALLPDLIEYHTCESLVDAKMALVSLGGSENVPNAMNVLREMGLPCKAIVDLDFAFKVAPQHGLLDSSHDSHVAIKQILLDLASRGEVALGDDGFPKKQGDTFRAEQGWECLAKQEAAIPHIRRLHDELKSRNLWLWPGGAIEAHLPVQKSDKARHRFLKQLRGMNVSTLSEPLSLDQTVKDAIEWLRA